MIRAKSHTKPMARAKEQHSRPPLERILEFHRLIQANRYPNCSSLARMFEVHLRTVNRDLEFMRDTLRLPMKYDSQRRGFYYTKPVSQFPAIPMTESEIFALLVAHKAIAQYQGTPFERPLVSAFKKLSGQLDQTTEYGVGGVDEMLSFRPFAPEEADLETFEIITRALRQRRVLSFTYRNLGAGHSRRRTVHPYHMACINNVWYLLCHDLERKDIRTFVLTRLSDPEIEPGTFAVPRCFDANKHLAGSLGPFVGKHDYEVVIEFDRWGTDLIRGRRWHHSQQLTDLPEGCSRLRLRLNSIEEMVGWILSWGRHARVLKPLELQRRVYAEAKEVLGASHSSWTDNQPKALPCETLFHGL